MGNVRPQFMTRRESALNIQTLVSSTAEFFSAERNSRAIDRKTDFTPTGCETTDRTMLNDLRFHYSRPFWNQSEVDP
jgi:hypothetical protein